MLSTQKGGFFILLLLGGNSRENAGWYKKNKQPSIQLAEFFKPIHGVYDSSHKFIHITIIRARRTQNAVAWIVRPTRPLN